MKCLCLIYGASDIPVDATRIRPASEATTVRVRDGRVQVTEGPFAETADDLVGIQVLDCETVEDALARAVEVRAAAVEVRPEYVEEAA
ncbi:MAG: hypothetical protein ICV67_01500 [Thermoleophilia bacterium]|nr:hypothetical protein [Thermoleophilia bacterium]